MKKIVRLTEADLARIVKRVIKENEGEELFATHDYQGGKYYDTMDRRVDSDIEFSETREFGPEDYDSFMEYINNCDTRWCLTTKKMYDSYASKGKITVGKGRRKVRESDEDFYGEMPIEVYMHYIDEIIEDITEEFNLDLENDNIRGTYDIDVYVDKMKLKLDKLFMDFMYEEDLSDDTANELTKYADDVVKDTVDYFYDSIEGMDFNKKSFLSDYINDFIEELHKRFDLTTNEVREIIDTYGDDLEVGFKDGKDVKKLLNVLVKDGKLKWRR